MRGRPTPQAAHEAHEAASHAHTAYLYSDGGAEFSEVNISKLRPYGEF